MPPYPWLIEDDLDYGNLPAKIRGMQTLGVPYPEGFDEQATADLERQAAQIAATLADEGIEVAPNKEIIAMIAYLQRLGTDISKETAENL